MWPNKTENSVEGYSPIECFVYFDTHGEELPCDDVEKYNLILHGKEMINLQIKMWVDTTYEIPITLMPNEVREYTKDYPSWVYESYIRQLSKLYKTKIGFVPSFVKNSFTP